MNYYNEFDKNAAAWLRELIKQGQIPEGEVDERSITEVRPEEIRGYTQCHFFAGIGGWPLALHLAGWPSDRPVWTGSCPCQPFSVAGKKKGAKDERHLWPEFRRLIADGSPPIVLGEQVASKDGRLWFAGVRADLEELGYAVGASDLCAAGLSAPRIRQRLYWAATRVGQSFEPGLEGHAGNGNDWSGPGWIDSEPGGSTSATGDSPVVTFTEVRNAAMVLCGPFAGGILRGLEGQSITGDDSVGSAGDSGLANNNSEGREQLAERHGAEPESSRGSDADGSRVEGGMADTECSERRSNIEYDVVTGRRVETSSGSVGSGQVSSGMADTTDTDERAGEQQQQQQEAGTGSFRIRRIGPVRYCLDDGMADTDAERLCAGGHRCAPDAESEAEGGGDQRERVRPDAGELGSGLHPSWGEFVWLICTDGKARRIPVEPGVFPLAAGIPGRVGLLRGYGNAIVPPLAAEFILAFQEACWL